MEEITDLRGSGAGDRVIRICMTGPECTGKTTLAKTLSREFGVPVVPEAAREYAERVARPLTSDDVERIAHEHIALATEAEEHARAVVLDTDLVSTVVYGKYYYDFSSRWLDTAAAERLAGVYLLCDVDVPWEADGIRDRPDGREEMFTLFRDALATREARVVVVRGDWDERLRIARDTMRDYLSS